MSSKIEPSAPKFVPQTRNEQTPAHSSASQKDAHPSATGFGSTSQFTNAVKSAVSLDGAPKNAPALQGERLTAAQLALYNGQVSSHPVSSTLSVPRAGMGGRGNPYDDSQEFGHALHSVYARYGEAGAGVVQAVVDQLQQGRQPAVSTAVPQPGDVMVWGPNAGVYESEVGQADQAGHLGVVESVTENPDGTVTLRVSERNWDLQHGQMGGVPYRDITLERDEHGNLVMPDGVGFVSTNPNPAQAAPPVAAPGTSPGQGATNPPLGPNPAHANDPSFQINHTPAHNPQLSYNPPGTNPYNNYTQCVGYIHDMPQFGPLIEQWTAQQPDHYLSASEIPYNSDTPTEGSLIIWPPGPADDTLGGRVGGDGHVGYVEDMQPNYDPPGDPNGRVVSYSITISEANANGSGNDDRSLRTFTVPADENGRPVLPDNVHVYDPNLANGSGAPIPAPAGAPASSPGQTIPHGSTYTVVAGDNLTTIAARAGVSVQQIMDANPGLKDPNQIWEGQVLQIP